MSEEEFLLLFPFVRTMESERFGMVAKWWQLEDIPVVPRNGERYRLKADNWIEIKQYCTNADSWSKLASIIVQHLVGKATL